MWKETLQVTGGMVRPNKCSWVLIDFAWVGPTYTYKTIEEFPAAIYLENAQGTMVEVERKEPFSPVENLGIQTVVNGSEDAEVEYLQKKIKSWVTLIEQSTLPPSLNINPLFTRITKTIQYPLPTTCFSNKHSA